MISSIRLIALAATVAAAALPAQAAPLLVLDFLDLAPLVTESTPLPLNGREFKTTSGQSAITFGDNAGEKAKAIVASSDPLTNYPPDTTGGKSHGVFAVNDGVRTFRINFDPGFDVDLLTLDAVTSDAALTIKIFDEDDKVAVVNFGATAGAWVWAEDLDTGKFNDNGVIRDLLSEIGNFKSIEFSADGIFGIDNLQFGLSTCGKPPCDNPVPEPASFGLVALALMGAGVASRRRKAASA